MYYVIEHKYVGANQDSEKYIDADRIEISKSPAITNSSQEQRIEGWCGTTDDWAIYAHGKYETTEKAENAIAQKFGYVRDVDPNGYEFLSSDDVIEVFKIGKYEPMSSQATEDWAYESIQTDITASTTDERLSVLVSIYEAEANSQGYSLNSDLLGFMEQHREELQSD